MCPPGLRGGKFTRHVAGVPGPIAVPASFLAVTPPVQFVGVAGIAAANGENELERASQAEMTACGAGPVFEEGIDSRLRTERNPPNLMFIRCEIMRRLSPRGLRSMTSRAMDLEILLGAPNFLPRARARVIPARVRLRINSRSENRQRSEQVPLQSPRRSGRVDPLIYDDHSDTGRVRVVPEAEDHPKRPAESVHLRDDHRVELAVDHALLQLFKRGSVVPGP